MAGIDRAVIEGLQRGDDQAYRAVVASLLGPVYRFLLRLSGNQGVAEDLAQETFLAVWQGIDSLRSPGQFRSWVFGIAYRQFLRHRDQRQVETIELGERQPPDGAADPEAALEEAEERRRLRQAVQSLPDIYREAFCLVHLEGLTYREASRALGIRVGTVKSRMHVALRLLREALGGREVGVDGTQASRAAQGRRFDVL